jgi:hypothetical protein
VDVELRYVEGCPNLTVTRQRLALALAAVGRSDTGVRLRLIGTAEEAQELGFVGSPTVLVDETRPRAVVSALPRRRGHVRIGRCRAVDRCLGSAAWRCVGPIAMAADDSTIDRAEIAADLERARVEFHR